MLFGNNFGEENSEDCQIELGLRPSHQNNFFSPIISRLDKHLVLLLIDYIAGQLIQPCQENHYP